MSVEIDAHRVQQYKDNVVFLSQQRMSRLRSTVRDDGDIVGKKVFFDRIGATAAQKVTTRHADTPLMNTPHSRRAAVMFDYDWGDLVDQADKLKTIHDPTNSYAVMGSAAMGRSQDDEIIGALGGLALTGEEGTTSVALPAAQKIAAAATNLTLAKLLSAKEKMDEAEVDEMTPRYFAVTAKMLTSLLNTTEIKSADYNTVKALVKGDFDTFLGFKFIRTQRLLTDGSGDRLAYAYAGTAIGLGVPKDIMVDIGPRRDKRMSTQVYVCMSLGGVRIEDEQVIEVACVGG